MYTIIGHKGHFIDIWTVVFVLVLITVLSAVVLALVDIMDTFISEPLT